jgi:predicted component of type VI protein secretion system
MTRFQIIMRAGPTPGQTYDLTENDITIGRDINADIVISVPEISRRHARFRSGPGGYVLEDLGSTNGTFVNGKRLTVPQQLNSGDIIMFGEAVTMVFEGGDIGLDATVVSPSSQDATLVGQETPGMPPSKAATMYAHDPVAGPPPQVSQEPEVQPAAPAFSGQVPAGPVDFGEEMLEEEPKSRTWLWASLGCIVVLLCGCVAGAILFDMMDMYCQPPFDSLFSFLYTCP